MSDMKKITDIRNIKGYSMVELLTVMAIIGILAFIAVPQYSDYLAKSSVRQATSDLLQNARLARTLAIKENQPYVIAFNIGGANTYSIGFDTNGDGIPEGYDNGPVRLVNLQSAYGSNVAFGTTAPSVPDYLLPNQCPACTGTPGNPVLFGATAGPVREVFNPDGSVASTGYVFINHVNTLHSYMLKVGYQSGKFDLWKWDGERSIPNPPTPTECLNPPLKYCGWTELR
jgi:prepilin-type N-terminal cleavage/methylation domain-containing protein